MALSLALQPVPPQQLGAERGGTHLQCPRKNGPSSLPCWLQGLSTTQMGYQVLAKHPREGRAHPCKCAPASAADTIPQNGVTRNIGVTVVI